jgi:SAM-dependent methyltransferase
MFKTTVSALRCVQLKGSKNTSRKLPCASALKLSSEKGELAGPSDIQFGTLECETCHAKYPILAGVAIVVPEVKDYLFSHVKGISKFVDDAQIPKAYRAEYLEVKAEILEEHIEEDLESERVNSLYLLNHYLRAEKSERQKWWKPSKGESSPLVEELVEKYWDLGPFSIVEKWVSELKDSKQTHAVELGCGVGGLSRVLAPYLKSYLGVDSSFASIVLARHLNLGARSPKIEGLQVPGDLIHGATSQNIPIEPKNLNESKIYQADFIVGEIQTMPVKEKTAELTIALNSIDMLDEPISLPRAQAELLRENGLVIQSCPYIWHTNVAKHLKSNLPRELKESEAPSAGVVEWLYQKCNFQIEKRLDHVPWLFFKHFRQLELYSVHIFLARKQR